MFEAVAGGTDPLLPHFSGGQVQGLQRRIEAGVPDDMKPRLDAQQRTGCQVRSGLVRRNIQAAALPRCVGVVRAQGSGV
jgi:hypothetical protein